MFQQFINPITHIVMSLHLSENNTMYLKYTNSLLKVQGSQQTCPIRQTENNLG